MKIVRRLALTVVIAAVLSAVAFGSGWALRPSDEPDRDHPATVGSTTEPDSAPTEAPPTSAPPATETPDEPAPPPALLAPGDKGPDVKDLQARLRQIDWFEADVTGFYGDVTTEAVKGFQGKRGFPVTGEVDQRTLDRLHAMTTEPTEAELTNQLGDNVPGPLDPRCETGRALCIDKSTRTLRWVVDGQVQKTVDVRFGAEYTPTREGAFTVLSKSRDHVSHLYGSSMPFAMFFSGGQAVHYSSDFAAVGYAGASHGCVNVRDYDGIAWLFDQVNVGDKVIVYWS